MDVREDLLVGAASHVGRRRTTNEDDILLYEPHDPLRLRQVGRVFGVADGISGTLGGAEASRNALRAFLASFLDQRDDGDSEQRLRDAFAAACQRVHTLALENSHLRRMGTTLTVARVADGAAEVCHVGDSRCLLVRGTEVKRITEDHVGGEDGSRIRRFVGGGRTSEIMDYVRVELQPDDILVLCTDGLWSVVPEAEILGIVSAHDPPAAAEELLRRALARGGPDNTSLIVVRYGGTSGSGAAGVKPVRVLSEIDVPAALPEPDPLPGAARWPGVLLWIALVLIAAATAKLLGFDVLAWMLDHVRRVL